MIRIIDLLDKEIKETRIAKHFLEWMDSHEVLVLERISDIFGRLL